jgi:hypothetical protein
MSYIDWWETPGQTEPTRTTLTLRGALIYPKTTVCAFQAFPFLAKNAGTGMSSHLTANEQPYRAVETRGSKRPPLHGRNEPNAPREAGPYHLKTNEEIWFWAEDLKPARRTFIG